MTTGKGKPGRVKKLAVNTWKNRAVSEKSRSGNVSAQQTLRPSYIPVGVDNAYTA